MSTIYTFHQECPALGAVPAADDEVLLFDTSAGRTKNVTVEELAGAPHDVVSGTTAAAFANYGVTVTQTTLGAFSLAQPTQSGVEKIILFPASTGIRTVTPASAVILGSTISPGGATTITVTGTSDTVSASIRLISQGTTNWYIVGRSGPAVTS